MSIKENLEELLFALKCEPELLINLDTFQVATACGTLHCSLGLAATLPHFNVQGLTYEGRGLLFDGKLPNTTLNSSPWLNRMFGQEAFNRLFNFRNLGLWDADIEKDLEPPVSDKDLAIARLERQLEMYS